MVRYEDPPGAIKHLRFGRPDHLELIKQFPGVKAIVLHKKGKTGEHPHLHVWWEGAKAVTNQTLKNNFKKLWPEVFDDKTQYHSQNDWTMRNHDSWDAWSTYVCKNSSHEILLGYSNLETVSINQKNLIVAQPITITSPVVLKKRPNAEERLIAYAVGVMKWKPGDHFNIARQLTFDQIADQARRVVLAYSNGRVHNNQLIAMTRNLMWHFSDDELQELLASKIGANLKYFD